MGKLRGGESERLRVKYCLTEFVRLYVCISVYVFVCMSVNVFVGFYQFYIESGKGNKCILCEGAMIMSGSG